MTIIALQRRIAECGRIRIGQQVQAKNGKSRPAKLDTFRITSPDKRRIEEAARLYGGKSGQWDAPAGKQWEVITQADNLPVIVPPSAMAFSMHYELWSAAGCQRRCDGVTEGISDRPCVCDPDARECSIHTRLSVMLRDLAGLGVWRLDTQGYYAAVELSAAVDVIQAAAGQGAMLPARLRLEQRSVTRPDKDGKPETRRFAVPMLDIEVTPAQLLGGGAGMAQVSQASTGTGQIEAPRPALTPVPEDLPTGPASSIAEQSAPPAEKPKRANAAPAIPASGRNRREGRAPKAAPEAPPDEAEEPPDWSGMIRSRAEDAERLRQLWHQASEMGAGQNVLDQIGQAGKAAADPANGKTAPDGADKPITQAQSRKLHAVCRNSGLTDDGTRRQLVGILAERNVESTNDLTKAEAATVIDALESLASAGDLPDVAISMIEDAAQTTEEDEPNNDNAAQQPANEDDQLWYRVLATMPTDWDNTRAADEFQRVMHVHPEEATAEHMRAYLDAAQDDGQAALEFAAEEA